MKLSKRVALKILKNKKKKKNYVIIYANFPLKSQSVIPSINLSKYDFKYGIGIALFDFTKFTK